MCRIAPADVDVTVVLDRGRALEVRFPGLPADWSAPSGHITWGQAGCRVALDEFSSVQLPPGSDGTQRVLFSDFPNEMSFVHTIWGERAQRVTILNDVLIIPFAGPR
jgi:hypothetical protein